MLFRPQQRVVFAWALLAVSLVGWPMSALTLARGEPQFILGLSWLAITITALDVLFTADVRREQESEDSDSDSSEATRQCEQCGHRLGEPVKDQA